MDSQSLRATQAPLKEKYQTNPDAAVVRLRAEANGAAGIACKIDTGVAMVEAGLHPATGGDGSQACSGDMLLEALVACAGVTFQAVATAFEIDAQNLKVTAEGELDFRGTLGVDKEASVGFQNIRLNFDFSSNASQETTEKVIELTEKYCVVLQTIKQPPELTVTQQRLN